ncbi:MAG TPA: hypothetical protein PKW50_02130 [Syntrophomonas sp.]|nr:hypothetical protein [Syntrophomonas sp.]
MARRKSVEIQVAYKGWEGALDSFLLFKKAQGLRESTLESYKTFISIFFRRYPLAYENKAILNESLIAFLSQDISPSTYNLRYIYLKAFINWGIEEGIFVNNPLNKFKRRKTNPRIIDIPIAKLKKLLNYQIERPLQD